MQIPQGLINLGTAAGPWATLASCAVNVVMKSIEDSRIEKKLDDALKMLRDVQDKMDSIDTKCDEILKKLDEAVEKISTKIDMKALQEHHHVLDAALETASLLVGRDGHLVITDDYWNRLYASLLALFEDEWRITMLARVHCHAMFMTALTEGKLKPVIDARIRKNILPRLDKRIAELRAALERDSATLAAALDGRSSPFTLRGIIENPKEALRGIKPPITDEAARQFETDFTRTGLFVKIEHNFDDALQRMADFRFETRRLDDAWIEPQQQIVHAMVEHLREDKARRTWLAASAPVAHDPLTATQSLPLWRVRSFAARRAFNTLRLYAVPGSWHPAPTTRWRRWAWNFVIGHVGPYNAARYRDWLTLRLQTIRATAASIASNTDMLVEAMAIRKMFERFLEPIAPLMATMKPRSIAVAAASATFGLPFAMLDEMPKTRLASLRRPSRPKPAAARKSGAARKTLARPARKAAAKRPGQGK